MGCDASKTHECFTVAPAPAGGARRTTEVVDLRDDRPAGAAPLQLRTGELKQEAAFRTEAPHGPGEAAGPRGGGSTRALIGQGLGGGAGR